VWKPQKWKEINQRPKTIFFLPSQAKIIMRGHNKKIIYFYIIFHFLNFFRHIINHFHLFPIFFRLHTSHNIIQCTFALFSFFAFPFFCLKFICLWDFFCVLSLVLPPLLYCPPALLWTIPQGWGGDFPIKNIKKHNGGDSGRMMRKE